MDLMLAANLVHVPQKLQTCDNIQKKQRWRQREFRLEAEMELETGGTTGGETRADGRRTTDRRRPSRMWLTVLVKGVSLLFLVQNCPKGIKE